MEYELTQLQYAVPVKGENFRLYIYDKDGFHSGGQWFTSGPIKYPEEQIDCLEAAVREMKARNEGLETKVTNAGDMLVFHSVNGEILYPRGISGGEFWKRL